MTSSFLFMLIFMKKRSVSWDLIFSFDFLLTVSALIFYTITLLKLYITTLLLIVYEIFIKNKKLISILKIMIFLKKDRK